MKELSCWENKKNRPQIFKEKKKYEVREKITRKIVGKKCKPFFPSLFYLITKKKFQALYTENHWAVFKTTCLYVY